MSAAARRRPVLPALALLGVLLILGLTLTGLVLTCAAGRALPWQFALPAVSVHVALAIAVLGLTAVQLALPRRWPHHRLTGYVWCGLMAVIAISGLAVRLPVEPGDPPIHQMASLFSIATLILLPLVVHFGRTRRRRAHRAAILALVAILFLAGSLSFIPHRALGGLFANGQGEMSAGRS